MPKDVVMPLQFIFYKIVMNCNRSDGLPGLAYKDPLLSRATDYVLTKESKLYYYYCYLVAVICFVFFCLCRHLVDQQLYKNK